MKKMRTLFTLLCVTFFLSTVSAGAKTIDVPTGPSYSEVDTKLVMDTIKEFRSGQAGAERAAMKIQADPSKFAPLIFYPLASYLFSQGKKDEAVEWLLRGQLRTRYDANRCADVSARSGVGTLNAGISPQIRAYMNEIMTTTLPSIVERVIEWDRTTPYNYDERWLNLHGMGAIQDGLKGGAKKEVVFSLPKSEWPSIAEKTRQDYFAGFKKVMDSAKKEAEALSSGTDIELPDEKGRTLLMKMANAGRSNDVRKLLERGAKIDARDSMGYTPLYYAILSRDLPTLQVMIEKGIDPNAQDDEGRTPLITAISAINMEGIQELLRAGADPSIKAKSGMSARDYANQSPIMKGVFDNIK